MNQKLPNRQSIRLKGYDYSKEGLYFITLVCQNRLPLFGKINNGVMLLNDAGKMIELEWLKLKIRFPNIELHEFVVMPDHFHGIVEITDAVSNVGAFLVGARNEAASHVRVPLVGTREGQAQSIADGRAQGVAQTTVGSIIGAFKSITTVEYIKGVKEQDWQAYQKRLWLRNYYEHIIRNDGAFDRISDYIRNNPANWQKK
ncbi:transposase [Marinifilum flexuosum]|uniref:transposase n=1 Tax=Marinifilum flexuosum TaxID=1117708 RepID=UPI0024948990|nr:transposase [Marinifilum flexuosum]